MYEEINKYLWKGKDKQVNTNRRDRTRRKTSWYEKEIEGEKKVKCFGNAL